MPAPTGVPRKGSAGRLATGPPPLLGLGPPAGPAGGLGEPEVHLPLKGVDLGNLHLDLVAEFEEPAGAPADKLAAPGIELIKIIA